MYQIDNQSRIPVYEQIIRQVEQYVLAGILEKDHQLPSVRALSLQLHLNPNTVQKAYAELERRQVIYTASGVGCFVSGAAVNLLREERRGRLSQLKPAIRELRLSGVTQQEIEAQVRAVYKEETQ